MSPLLSILVAFWIMLATAAANESLVISTIVDFPGVFSHYGSYVGFMVVELTACSNIANISRYTLEDHDGVDCQSTNATHILPNMTTIPKGTRIYFASEMSTRYPFISIYIPDVYGMSIDRFVSFFGIEPTYFSSSLRRFCWPSRLVLDGTVVVDAFEPNSSIATGWAGRLPGSSPSSHSNMTDWNMNYEALRWFPFNNSLAKPPVQFTSYQCPPTPMFRPTKPTPKLVSPPKKKRPQHTCVSGRNVVYTSTSAKCQAPSCKDRKGASIGVPFAVPGCGCGCRKPVKA